MLIALQNQIKAPLTGKILHFVPPSTYALVGFFLVLEGFFLRNNIHLSPCDVLKIHLCTFEENSMKSVWFFTQNKN